MSSNLSRQVSVNEMAGDERRSAECLLGRPLNDDQQVYILAFTPDVVPDSDTRRRAKASMQQTFARAELHANRKQMSEAEIDEAIDEAVNYVRYRKT